MAICFGDRRSELTSSGFGWKILGVCISVFLDDAQETAGFDGGDDALSAGENVLSFVWPFLPVRLAHGLVQVSSSSSWCLFCLLSFDSEVPSFDVSSSFSWLSILTRITSSHYVDILLARYKEYWDPDGVCGSGDGSNRTLAALRAIIDWMILQRSSGRPMHLRGLRMAIFASELEHD